MSKVNREVVTIFGKNIVLAHADNPIANEGVLENAEIFRLLQHFLNTSSPAIATRLTAPIAPLHV